ncbi:MAG TPA: zinc transporter ZntB [Alphaproteobacteria bacterium]|nr:zinc transporter ZntB [Alphaproteobacteria bacterium]
MADQAQDTGLIYAYVLDGKGGGRKVNLEEATTWKPGEGFLWVHLDWNEAAAIQWINANVEAPEVAETLTTGDTRPRAVRYDDHLLLTLRGVNLNPDSNPEDMVSLRAWIGPDRAITTRHRRIMAVADMCDRLDKGTGPKGPGDFLTFITDQLVDRMLPTITSLNEVIDDLEDSILDGDEPASVMRSSSAQFRQSLSLVRRRAISLRRYLAPQREALNRLQIEEQGWLGARHRVLLREASDHVTRYVEDLDAIRDRGAVIQDELRNQLSEDMNRTMYVLTVVAAVLLPLGFITGLLGINVDGMPGSKDMPSAFWIVVGLCAVFALAQVWLFRRLRWL